MKIKNTLKNYIILIRQIGLYRNAIASEITKNENYTDFIM